MDAGDELIHNSHSRTLYPFHSRATLSSSYLYCRHVEGDRKVLQKLLNHKRKMLAVRLNGLLI
ncbi:hypothetical protein VARIO8X_90061 [Burkholderiales bacterium 8X]|nr:hypothetical protein VARIO8X_90061 [Burkholderiales bacterium 8X]